MSLAVDAPHYKSNRATGQLGTEGMVGIDNAARSRIVRATSMERSMNRFCCDDCAATDTCRGWLRTGACLGASVSVNLPR